MKLMSLLGVCLATALLFAFPAAAAVSPAFETVSPLQVVTEAHPMPDTATEVEFVVYAELGNAPVPSDLVGVCLFETSLPAPAGIAAIVPDERGACTATRPSPPG